MNKEQLRKLLSILEKANNFLLNGTAIFPGSVVSDEIKEAITITTRLAALDDGDQKKGQCNDPAIYYKDDVVDDGQEGKGLRWVKDVWAEKLYKQLHHIFHQYSDEWTSYQERETEDLLNAYEKSGQPE